MERVFYGLTRIKEFSFELIHIISTGASETIEKIEEEIRKENIIQYISSKYYEIMMIKYDEKSIYDLESWNREIMDYLDNDSKKFSRENRDNGLLLLLFIIVSLLEEPKNRRDNINV